MHSWPSAPSENSSMFLGNCWSLPDDANWVRWWVIFRANSQTNSTALFLDPALGEDFRINFRTELWGPSLLNNLSLFEIFWKFFLDTLSSFTPNSTRGAVITEFSKNMSRTYRNHPADLLEIFQLLLTHFKFWKNSSKVFKKR